MLSENSSYVHTMPKMQAMLKVALNCDFDNIREKDIKNYFWELESLANAAEALAEDLI